MNRIIWLYKAFRFGINKYKTSKYKPQQESYSYSRFVIDCILDEYTIHVRANEELTFSKGETYRRLLSVRSYRFYFKYSIHLIPKLILLIAQLNNFPGDYSLRGSIGKNHQRVNHLLRIKSNE